MLRQLKFFAIAILVLAALGLMIFGPRTATPATPGRVIVQYWEHWSGKEAEAMQAIVNDFNNTVGRQKNIYVQFLSQSNINQKALLATAAGVPPDIAGLWDQPLPQWAALDALEPLDELARAHGITADTYKSVYWNACHYNGRLIALLSTPNDVALFWNREAFLNKAAELKAAGLDPTRAPRTPAELDQYAAVLHARDTTGRLLNAGYLPTEPGWYMQQTPFWFGASLYDRATGRFTLDSVETTAAFDWIASYSRQLGANTIADFHSGLGPYNSAGNPFLTGQLVMQLQGPWVATVIENNKPGMNAWRITDSTPSVALTPTQRAARAQWAAAPFPSVYSRADMTDDQLIDNAVTWCGFDALVIPRRAKHKAEAFEFIAYVQQQEVMEKLCALQCKGTPLRTHSASWYQNHPNPHAELFDRLATSPHAVSVPPVPVWPEAMDEMATAINRVAALERTPAEAASDLQNSLQGKLDQFRARHPEASRTP